MRLRAVLLLNAATLLWAANAVAGRALRTETGPFALTGFRVMVASLCFLALWPSWRWKAGEGPTRREWLLLTLMGFCGAAAFQVLQYTGLRYTTAANAGLVNAINPVVTLMLSRLFLDIKFGLKETGGALLSVMGVALLVFGNGFTKGAGGVNPGDLIMLLAIVSWGFYTIIGKKLLDKRDAVWVTSLSTLLSLPFLAVPFGWELIVAPPNWSPKLVAAILLIGVGPAFIAFLAWNQGVKLLGPNAATVFINTLALYATILSALINGEPPGKAALVGGVLIVSGCLVALWRNEAKTNQQKVRQ